MNLKHPDQYETWCCGYVIVNKFHENTMKNSIPVNSKTNLSKVKTFILKIKFKFKKKSYGGGGGVALSWELPAFPYVHGNA